MMAANAHEEACVCVCVCAWQMRELCRPPDAMRSVIGCLGRASHYIIPLLLHP